MAHGFVEAGQRHIFLNTAGICDSAAVEYETASVACQIAGNSAGSEAEAVDLDSQPVNFCRLAEKRTFKYLRRSG